MGHYDIITNRVYLRIFSNCAAVLIIGMVIWALFYQKQKQYKEAPPIKWENVETIIIKAKPEIPDDYVPPVKKNNNALNNSQSENVIQNYLSAPINKNGINQSTTNATNSTINKGQSKSVPTLPKFSNPTQRTIISTECLTKIDSEDRPKGCPPNDVARKLIQAARAPKYRPEMVEGFSRAEENSRYYAGIRGKCQKDDGGQSTVCIPIGKKPARVKTPYELCIEMGMGGCTRPPRPDGSKDESFNYGNE
jgi:hypothetical protein